jgi:hypothetical protein
MPQRWREVNSEGVQEPRYAVSWVPQISSGTLRVGGPVTAVRFTLCLSRGDEAGLDASDGAKPGTGEDDAQGPTPAGAVQLCICAILASAILPVAAVRTVTAQLEALLRAAPSPPNRHTRAHHRVLPAQRALTTRARRMRTTDAGKTSISASLLNAEAAPEGAALWLQMVQEQNQACNPRAPSGRLHRRLPCTGGNRFV